MEPREQNLLQTPKVRCEQKPRRFRIVMLEERIAPSKGGNHTHNGGACATGTSTYCAN